MKDIIHSFKLPASKSISNRILLIRALCEYYNKSNKFKIENLAECDDTNRMLSVLNTFFSNNNINNVSTKPIDKEYVDKMQYYDINHAGTAMRFLTAFLSIVKGQFHLNGSNRMQIRPIKILVDALNSIGANIRYAKNEGYPPLIIKGSSLEGGEIDVDSSISSQYISSLMMIAPYMKKGLTINLVGGIVSSPYIFMTNKIMEQLEAKLSFYYNDKMYPKKFTDLDIKNKRIKKIKIYPIPYLSESESELKSNSDIKERGATIKLDKQKLSLKIESDWSAASYFYEYLLIKGHGKLRLDNLYSNSMQGDSRQVEYWKYLGITTTFQEDSIIIEKKFKSKDFITLDFTEMPDIALSFIVACCLNDVKFTFTGLITLSIKECDRIDAITKEMRKLGYILLNRDLGVLSWDGDLVNNNKTTSDTDHIIVETHDDHRMAMSLAPAIIKFPNLIIKNPEVVAKSFPRFWEQTKTLF